MDFNEIHKLLQKFSKEQLLQALRTTEWLNVDSQKNDLSSLSKQKMIHHVLRLLKEYNFSSTVFEELDLLYIRAKQTSRIWKLYRLKSDTDDEFISQLLEPAKFTGKFSEELEIQDFPVTSIFCKIMDEALWIRTSIEVQNKKKKAIQKTVYIIHYFHTPYFIASCATNQTQNVVFPAITNTLQYSEFKLTQLKGRNIRSLAQHAWNTDNPGFRLLTADSHPLSKSRLSKRKVEEIYLDERIQDECLPSKKNRNAYIEKTFGSRVQPHLQLQHYELETNFRGSRKLQDESFHCNLTFEGPSVLNGIKMLVSAGCMNPPLPAHLANIGILGKSKIKLTSCKNSTFQKSG